MQENYLCVKNVGPRQMINLLFLAWKTTLIKLLITDVISLGEFERVTHDFSKKLKGLFLFLSSFMASCRSLQIFLKKSSNVLKMTSHCLAITIINITSSVPGTLHQTNLVRKIDKYFTGLLERTRNVYRKCEPVTHVYGQTFRKLERF